MKKKFTTNIDEKLLKEVKKKAIENDIDVNEIIESLFKKYLKEDFKMLKLIELREGGEIGVTKVGTLEEIAKYLKENEDLYTWIWDENDGFGPVTTPKPNFENIETIRDLKVELDKVDLGWWSLEIKEM